jgi:hypothetical protein
MSVRHNGRKPRSNRDFIDRIASQVKRLSDAEVYALAYSGDRVTSRLASRVAHQRAEAYAMREDMLTYPEDYLP